MAKKFSFFDWASGKSSARAGGKRSDVRRLAILTVGLIVVVGLIFAFRKVSWRGGDHPHEKGPHGGIITSINEGEPHYHAEVVVEDNGRIRLFLFGKDTAVEVAVKPQVFIASVKADHANRGGSVIFRAPSMANKTTEFIGRLLPSQVHQRLDVAVDKLEIADRVFSFRFELPSQHGHATDSASWIMFSDAPAGWAHAPAAQTSRPVPSLPPVPFVEDFEEVIAWVALHLGDAIPAANINDQSLGRRPTEHLFPNRLFFLFAKSGFDGDGRPVTAQVLAGHRTCLLAPVRFGRQGFNSGPTESKEAGRRR